MSKNYLGRCAAVGIAGLTAMSSVAIVASAATQASIVYELQYNKLENVLMKPTVAYATGATKYCQRASSVGVAMDDGFNVDFTKLAALTASYQKANVNSTNNSIYYTTVTSGAVWDNADFTGTGISSGMTVSGWEYKAPTAANPTTPSPIALTDADVYADRTSGTGDIIFAFKTESERTAAKNAMITTIKNSYTTLANAATTQFRNDINAAAANAKKRLADVRDSDISTAKVNYEKTGKTASDTADYNAAVNTANNLYNASVNAVTTSASTIISEFTQTFNANSFNFDANVFETYNAPIKYSSTVGGLSVIADAKYTGISADETDLSDSRYWAGSTMRTDGMNYVFKGEIQPSDVFDGSKSFVFIGNTLNWVNVEVIDNGSTTGGNTTVNGNTNTETKDDTTTTTTWYPSSSTYRNPSEVSYLGENGSWYTSASAATLYGGGYTGTSKSSDYASVNSSADGKAIYFNSATGSYSTSSTSYSYIVKEATSSTSTSDDPYYSYFFNNGTTSSTTTTTAAAGSASIKGASKYAGWTNITSYITNKAKSGATYSINMNDETVVPSTVLAAAKAKNVTLTFINDNGSKVTVKPGKVSSDLDVSVIYNVKDVKTSLVNKAKKVNSGTVSTAQVRISEDGSIGGTATVNVKFSTKRAGCKVKAYRLSESGSLVKNATGTINSSGRVNLNLTKGGSYLLVVIDD